MNVRGWLYQSKYQRAIDYYNCGMYLRAVEEFSRILDKMKRRHRDDREVLFYLAECYMAMGDERLTAGDLRGAINYYQEGLSLEVGFADLHYRTGRGYFLLGDLDRAAEAFRKALCVNPGYVDARFALAETYVKKGDLDLAILEFRALKDRCGASDVGHYTEAIAFLEQGDAKKGVAILGKIFQNVSSRSKTLYLKGISCYQDNDYAGAIRWFQELLEEYPEFPDVHNLLGVAWCGQKSYEAGEECFLKAIAINQKYVDPRLNLAFLYEKQDLHAKAIRQFKEVLQVDPQNVLAVEGLRRLEDKEQLEEASVE